MNESKLPPLPEPRTLSRGEDDGVIQLGYTADQMCEYGQRCYQQALDECPSSFNPPRIGEPWHGGIYAGIAGDLEGGAPGHLVLLDDRPTDKLIWNDAVKWAEALGAGARLPTKAEAALLLANIQGQFAPEWHWTGTQSSDLTAWYQHFRNGTQNGLRKSYEGRARAVRRIKEI